VEEEELEEDLELEEDSEEDLELEEDLEEEWEHSINRLMLLEDM